MIVESSSKRLCLTTSFKMSDAEDKQMLSRLKKAVGLREYQTVRRLVKGGVDVNQRFWYGSTLLLEAVSVSCLQTVEILIKAGADVNACNEGGSSALHIASRAGQTDTVAALLKAGANVDRRTLNGDTSLHLAVWRGHEKVVRKLLLAGAKVNVQNKEGWTPLRWAARLNDVTVARMLIEHGAAINYKNMVGETPLYEALLHNHYEMTKFLIVEGADVNLSPKKSSFPLLISKYRTFNAQGAQYLELLSVAGYNGSKDQILKQTLDQAPLKLQTQEDLEMFLKWIQLHRENVPSLTSLCRTRIRRRIGYCVQGRSIVTSVKKTPLPHILIDFLLFKNEISHSIT